MKDALRCLLRIVCVRSLQAALAGWAAGRLLKRPLLGPGSIGKWAAPALTAYFLYVFLGERSWGLPILTRLPGQSRRVALTFDDGPSPEVTPRILDLLSQAEVRATFFVLGERAERSPGLIRRIVAEGHTLALHSWDHAELVLPAARTIRRSLRRSLAVLPSGRVHHFRPPYGFKSLILPFLVSRLGLDLVGWSLDSRDYAACTSEAISRRVLSRVRPRDIVLLHDGPANALTADALPAILDGLARSGCTVVPLTDD